MVYPFVRNYATDVNNYQFVTQDLGRGEVVLLIVFWPNFERIA